MKFLNDGLLKGGESYPTLPGTVSEFIYFLFTQVLFFWLKFVWWPQTRKCDKYAAKK